MTLTVIAALSLIAVVTFLISKESERREHQLEAMSDYSVQIDNLHETQRSIQELMSFVNQQQVRIDETEKLLAELERRKDEPQPIVEANQESVDALFAEQESRLSSQMWWDRFYGFLSGIVASLIATVVWQTANKLRN